MRSLTITGVIAAFDDEALVLPYDALGDKEKAFFTSHKPQWLSPNLPRESSWNSST